MLLLILKDIADHMVLTHQDSAAQRYLDHSHSQRLALTVSSVPRRTHLVSPIRIDPTWYCGMAMGSDLRGSVGCTFVLAAASSWLMTKTLGGFDGSVDIEGRRGWEGAESLGPR